MLHGPRCGNEATYLHGCLVCGSAGSLSNGFCAICGAPGLPPERLPRLVAESEARFDPVNVGVLVDAGRA
jgi:hypothetical protein